MKKSKSQFDTEPNYKLLARQFTHPRFDANKLADAIAGPAPEKHVDQPTFYTPDWLVQLAKKMLGEKKPTMDFGRFHVTRAAIPGRTILTFRRKQEVDAEHDSVIPGRIIIAKIFKADGGNLKQTNQFVVKSYEAGEHPRVLFSGQTWVSMSKTEKMVYKMVKCNVKETQRRHVIRKRARATKETLTKKDGQ